MEIINQKSFDTIIANKNVLPNYFYIKKEKQFVSFQHIDKRFKNLRGTIIYDLENKSYRIIGRFHGEDESSFFRGYHFHSSTLKNASGGILLNQDIINSELDESFKFTLLRMLQAYSYDDNHKTSRYNGWGGSYDYVGKFFFGEVINHNFMPLLQELYQSGININTQDIMWRIRDKNSHEGSEDKVKRVVTALTKLKSIPKDVKKILFEFKCELNHDFIMYYSSYSETFNNLMRCIYSEKIYEETKNVYARGNSEIETIIDNIGTINRLIKDYNYQILAILRHYYNYIKIYENINYFREYITLLYDYANAYHIMNIKEFEKYPKYLRSKHDIAVQESKNYAKEYSNEVFKKNLNHSLAYNTKEYCVVIPETTNDLKNEGSILCHCVGNYIQRVIDRECEIYFMRTTENINSPLVTLEIRKQKFITQAKGMSNRSITKDEHRFISEWAKVKELELHL